jgi:hypothetical protein
MAANNDTPAGSAAGLPVFEEYLRRKSQVKIMISSDTTVEMLLFARKLRNRGIKSRSEQLLIVAANLVAVAAELQELTPVDGVLIGDMDRQADRSADLLARTVRALEVVTPDGAVVNPLQAAQGELVTRCRKLGMSWRKIAPALKMSPQGLVNKATENDWGEVQSGPTAASE